MSIVIIDYGVGNLKNLKNAFDFLGVASQITNSIPTIRQASKLMLPGVGAFGYAMENLRRQNLEDVIKKKACSGTPLFGICLGMQLLFSGSEESNQVTGLNLIPGKAKRFKIQLKVPHMGWNTIVPQTDSFLIKGLPENSCTYFVHSYYCEPVDAAHVLTTTNYEIDFASMVQKDSIFGAQFHPEKSQEVGLQILKNFVEF